MFLFAHCAILERYTLSKVEPWTAKTENKRFDSPTPEEIIENLREAINKSWGIGR